jgi:hypothetical protein
MCRWWILLNVSIILNSQPGEKLNMNSKVKFMRFVLAIVLVLCTLGVSTTVAFADQPTKYEISFTDSYVIEDLCPYQIEVILAVNGTGIDFFDTNGVLIRTKYHFNEQDSFTANGTTLVGLPYTFNVENLFDKNGNPTHVYATGVIEKIPFPDGSLFISAGQVDFAAHGFPVYILSPDKGNPGNIASLCAAFSS